MLRNEKQVNAATGRIAEHFLCASCGELFPSKFVVVDHIQPVVPVTGFVNWDDVITRMFCDVEGFASSLQRMSQNKN